MKTNKTILIDKTESLVESIVSDCVTFGFLLLCIYVSHGSAAWTLLTGILFICFVGGKAGMSLDKRSRIIKSKAEAIEWAQSFPEDGGKS